jgi:hypothetical protein
LGFLGLRRLSAAEQEYLGVLYQAVGDGSAMVVLKRMFPQQTSNLFYQVISTRINPD